MNDKTIFIIPFALPWDRSADYQRQTCFELAKKYHVVAYMQRDAIFLLKAQFYKKTFKYPTHKNITFYRPLFVIPFRRIKIIDNINQIVSYILFQLFFIRTHLCILWVFDPIFYLFPKLTHGISIYDCVDYHAGYCTGIKRIEIEIQERILIHAVDYFFVNSHTLNEIHTLVRKPDAIVPQGFRLNEFQQTVKISVRVPQDKPIIGYVGALDHRLDWVLLETLMRNNPQWIFVLWGPVVNDEEHDETSINKRLCTIFQLPNVITGKSSDRRKISAIIQQFTIGIIPQLFSLSGVRQSYPMKLFEYFYMGKPVVSTPIEELRRFSRYVYFGKTVKEWESHIHRILFSVWSLQYQREQKKLAIANSWRAKVYTIMKIIEQDQRS